MAHFSLGPPSLFLLLVPNIDGTVLYLHFFELYKSFYVHPHSNVTRQRLTMIVCSYSLQAYQLFLYTIDGSLPTGLLATACVVTAGRHVVSALPYRIRLLTNSIEKCLWFRTLSLSTST